MIRAIYRDGVIYPVESVPAEWKPGQDVHMEKLRDHPNDGRYRLALIRSILGKYAYLKTSSDAFAQTKRQEIAAGEPKRGGRS